MRLEIVHIVSNDTDIWLHSTVAHPIQAGVVKLKPVYIVDSRYLAQQRTFQIAQLMRAGRVEV